MSVSVFEYSHRASRSDRQRDWDEDQARWEAQLRKLGRQKMVDVKPVTVAPPVSLQTSLKLAAGITHRDMLLIPRTLPSFAGNESENLVCGKCSDIIGSRITPQTARRAHPEGDRLVVRCICGALNLLFANRKQ